MSAASSLPVSAGCAEVVVERGVPALRGGQSTSSAPGLSNAALASLPFSPAGHLVCAMRCELFHHAHALSSSKVFGDRGVARE